MDEGEADARLLSIAASLRPVGGSIGVAVSGGSDSTAALYLLNAAGLAVQAVTVDHGLRPEAADEARAVGLACAALGVPHTILRWDGPAPTGNLPDQARRARYRLIGGWARERGLTDVVIAHTADDQAETFLMRLAREAGIDGLSGMRAEWTEAGVTFRRPFLGVTRSDLRGYLKRRGIGWIEDPTNADESYARVKARRALGHLAPLGITVERLGAVTAHLASVRQAVAAQSAAVADDISRVVAGDVLIWRAALLAQPPEVRRRLLIGALRLVAGGGYAPRAAAVARLEAAVAGGRGATLAGCRIAPAGAELRIGREPRALRGVVAPTTALWDGRWHLDGPHDPALEVRALTARGLAQCPGWRDTGLPRETLAASPALWAGDRLVAAPVAGWPQGWRAELAKDRTSLATCILPH